MLFNEILTWTTVFTAGFWLAEKLWLKRRRRVRGVPEKPGALVDFFAGLFPVILAVFILRSFIVEPFRIPSGSMIPTLHIGDFVLVNKYQYGLRCPIGYCKPVAIGEPHRGDVVVFRFPKDPSQDFIKRVIGVPGDRIRYVDKTLSINGVPVPLTPDGSTYWNGSFWQIYEETLNGVHHQIMLNPAIPPRDFVGIVPPHKFFVMGDNRDDSDDSRFWGFVPEANLRGRAFLIWMSFNFDTFRPDFSRVGMIIH
ncbi:MAG: signal peptidase I [Gammaproteobacteria bacterium]|nr:signal peptidase I [Gammaproteobacteria bacterium]